MNELRFLCSLGLPGEMKKAKHELALDASPFRFYCFTLFTPPSSLSESDHFTTGPFMIDWSHDQKIQDR
jgi:hypothetical protein